MNCPSCHVDNRAERRFCWSCGTSLAAQACASCGFENFPHERYCGGCGIPTGDAPAVATSPPIAAEAERRQLTVMFLDLVGSTALSGQLDPEELREHIVAFQRTCAAEVGRFDGFVARYMGDGMLVYFGYPRAYEDSAERAVRAGLAVVGAVADLRTERFDPHVRVGIATGQVVVGDVIGAGASEERAVVGETPNLAARLQSLAKPDTVVISSRTKRLVDQAFEVEDLGRHPLKGFSEPMQAWRAVGTRSGARARVQDLPLVGRTFERSVLAERWRTTTSGQGQAVELVGDPGTGKSHLLLAFLEEIDGASAVLFHQARSHQGGTALQPVLDRIGAGAGLELSDTHEQRRQKLGSWVGGWSSDPEDVAAIQDLFSVGEAEGIHADARRDAILAALDHEIAARLHDGPVVLVFEDGQHADPLTLEFLGRQLDRAGSCPLLCLLTRRADGPAPWGTRGPITSMPLNRLTAPESQQLVDELAPELPEEVVQRILARGDGIPGYLVELGRAVQAAISEGASRGPIAVPETLHDSLAAQLDRLGTARDVAQTAAVLGREFSEDLLERVHPAGDVRQALEQLTNEEIVVPDGLDDGGRYRFRRALLRDVAYDSLLKRARRELHDRTAAVLLDELPDAAHADPGSVAWHLERAERYREAAHWYILAAERAASQTAHRESVAAHERAVAVLEPHANLEDRDHAATLGRALVSLARATRFTRPHDETAAMLARAEATATRHDLTELLSRVFFERGNLFFNIGDAERCTASHERALAEARRAGSILAEVRALGGLADAHFASCDLAAALAASRRCVTLAVEHEFTEIGADNAAVGAWCAYWVLDQRAARELAVETIRLGELSRNRRALASGYNALALLSAAEGDESEVVRMLDELRGLGLGDVPMVEAALMFNLQGLARLRGDPGATHETLAAYAQKLDPSAYLRSAPLSGMLAGVPQDQVRPVVDEVMRAIREAPLHQMMWASCEAPNSLMHRGEWQILLEVVRAVEERFGDRIPPRVALWMAAARAAERWAADPSDPAARRAIEAIVRQTRSTAGTIGVALEALTGLSASAPPEPGAPGRPAEPA